MTGGIPPSLTLWSNDVTGAADTLWRPCRLLGLPAQSWLLEAGSGNKYTLTMSRGQDYVSTLASVYAGAVQLQKQGGHTLGSLRPVFVGLCELQELDVELLEISGVLDTWRDVPCFGPLCLVPDGGSSCSL